MGKLCPMVENKDDDSLNKNKMINKGEQFLQKNDNIQMITT
jgi:hypothetical protein